VTTSDNNSAEKRAGVSISDMARACGLSRQRFGQLVKAGVFPQPLRDSSTDRPYYDEALQTVCLEVRKRNCGINGKVVLFYSRRQGQAPAPKERPAKLAPTEQTADILEGVKSLGLVQATASQVAEVVRELFPEGIGNQDLAEVIRAVFIRLRRKNSGENLGRK